MNQWRKEQKKCVEQETQCASLLCLMWPETKTFGLLNSSDCCLTLSGDVQHPQVDEGWCVFARQTNEANVSSSTVPGGDQVMWFRCACWFLYTWRLFPVCPAEGSALSRSSWSFFLFIFMLNVVFRTEGRTIMSWHTVKFIIVSMMCICEAGRQTFTVHRCSFTPHLCTSCKLWTLLSYDWTVWHVSLKCHNKTQRSSNLTQRPRQKTALMCGLIPE